MSKSNMEETYLLKKVGKYWLIGAEGRFKRVPVLTNAKEVEISDNNLIADDDIYEIQGNEAGEVTLVKMDDMPIHESLQSNGNIAQNANSSEKEASVDSKEISREENNLSDKSGTQEIKDIENTDDRWEDTTSETGPGEEYVDELEMGQTEDRYQSLEAAGHTEETSYIETIPLTETSIGEDENDGKLLENKQEKIKLSKKITSATENNHLKKSVQQTGIKKIDLCPKSETSAYADNDNQPDEQMQQWDKDKYYVSGLATKENLKVYIYESSILNLTVDCIVSASNSRLAHGGGIANVIAEAAGVDLTRQGNEYIKTYGPIPTGQVCTTTAGKLPYKYVIHAIGPAWFDYNPHTEDLIKRCETDLYNAVFNSLLEAERKGAKSVGLPALSSGIFGVPEEMCAHQYIKAVIDYSRNSVGRNNTLSEIHFIDKNTQMLQQIGKVFRSALSSRCIPEYDRGKFVVKSGFKSGLVETLETKMNLKSKTLINPNNVDENILSRSTDAKNVIMYTTLENLRVYVYQADILKVPVDCIVNASNDCLQHGGGVAAVIARAAGRRLAEECDEFIRRNGRVPVGATCVTTAGLLPYRCVIHAVGPRWSDHYPHGIVDVTRCERHLYNVLCDCFLQAEERKLRSIGLPAISSGIVGVPEMLCIHHYVKATIDYSKRATKGGHVLSEIHFIDKNPAIVKKIQEAFHITLVDKKQYPYHSRMFATDKTKGYQKY